MTTENIINFLHMNQWNEIGNTENYLTVINLLDEEAKNVYFFHKEDGREYKYDINSAEFGV